MTNLPAPDTYIPLRDEILGIIDEGKERARQAVEREKVHTYWAIGRALHTHLLEHGDRAGYGEYVVDQLAQDLNMGRRVLYRVQVYPSIRPL